MDLLEIYDTTLRDGEQTAGASFSLKDRVKLFEMLDDFGMDYIELGWPLASNEIKEAFSLCKNVRKNARIAAFGSTSIRKNPEEDENLNAILECKPDLACIFGKTWVDHIGKQLKISKIDNLNKIKESFRFLVAHELPVFYDAEHFFDGFKEDKNYALETLFAATQAGAERLILCDTNGGILPSEAFNIVQETK